MTHRTLPERKTASIFWSRRHSLHSCTAAVVVRSCEKVQVAVIIIVAGRDGKSALSSSVFHPGINAPDIARVPGLMCQALTSQKYLKTLSRNNMWCRAQNPSISLSQYSRDKEVSSPAGKRLPRTNPSRLLSANQLNI